MIAGTCLAMICLGGRVYVYRRTDVEKREGEKGRVYMAEGHDIQADIMLVESEINTVDQVKGNMRLMGTHYPFGFARGSGCVDQDPGVTGIHLYLRLDIR